MNQGPYSRQTRMKKNEIDPLADEEMAAWPKQPLVDLEKPFMQELIRLAGQEAKRLQDA